MEPAAKLHEPIKKWRILILTCQWSDMSMTYQWPDLVTLTLSRNLLFNEPVRSLLGDEQANCLANWSQTTYQFSVQSVKLPAEIRKSGTHVRTCRCTPSMVYVNCLDNWSLTTYQFSVRSVKPFSRYETPENICTCARADAHHQWPLGYASQHGL